MKTELTGKIRNILDKYFGSAYDGYKTKAIEELSNLKSSQPSEVVLPSREELIYSFENIFVTNRGKKNIANKSADYVIGLIQRQSPPPTKEIGDNEKDNRNSPYAKLTVDQLISECEKQNSLISELCKKDLLGLKEKDKLIEELEGEVDWKGKYYLASTNCDLLTEQIDNLKTQISDTDKFSIGYICAVANIVKSHGESTIAEDILKCNFVSVKYMKKIGVEDSDIEVLIPVIKEIERKRKLNK